MADERAQDLRKNATGPERRLWSALSRLRGEDFHFRRQVRFGGYIVDFASHRERLIVEVDGAQHYEDDVRTRDEERTRFLERCGYRLLRYSNYDVLQNLDGVIRDIFETANAQKRLKFAPLVSPPTRSFSALRLRRIDRPSAAAVAR